ncbi:unnamed protein product [Candidula unifasciata]|uniref:Uncharacterized protein n=1 Tax=Candidula unifasciata TaxID=100452 RepID=A0A8S3YW17_9EUPU|nr:unnamed protein product [Candidula unifasciata]
MNVSCSDYRQFWIHAETIAAIYIALSVTSLVVNICLLVTGFRLTKVRQSPKYWLVFAISLVFICQSTFVNNTLSTRWLLSATVTHFLWKICIIFNRYIAMGLICWGSFLINIDFLLCIKSVRYTRDYRGKSVLLLMILIWTSITTAVFTICFIRDSNETEDIVFPATEYHQALLTVTVFTPQILNILCCSLALVLRCSNKLQKFVTLNDDVSDPTDSGDCPYLPPLDHVTFALLLIIFYTPKAIVTFDPIWADECSEVRTFLIVSTLLRDNAGSVAPLVWFLFRDIRRSFLKCLIRRRGMSTSSLLDSSEMNIYDNYPYCQRIQA